MGNEMKQYLVWVPDWEETIEKARKIKAYDIKDAAQELVQREFIEEECVVGVRVKEAGSEEEWDVTVEIEVETLYYASKPMKVSP